LDDNDDGSRQNVKSQPTSPKVRKMYGYTRAATTTVQLSQKYVSAAAFSALDQQHDPLQQPQPSSISPVVTQVYATVFQQQQQPPQQPKALRVQKVQVQQRIKN
jgi:hypothetical protein